MPKKQPRGPNRPKPSPVLASNAPAASRRGFERWVTGVTEAPSRYWESVVDEYLASVESPEAEAEGAILLLALLGAGGWSGFLEGSWILHGVTARQLYFDGSGWGDARTLRLLQSFLTFVVDACPRHSVDRWDAAFLRSEVGRARVACGLPPESGDASSLRDFRCHLVDLPFLAIDLAPQLGPEARPWAFAAVKLVAEHACVEVGDRWFRFGRLRPEAFAAMLYFDYGCPRARCTCESARFRRGVHEAAAALYRYLGATEKLSPGRAEDLAQRLEACLESPGPWAGWDHWEGAA